MSMEEFCKTFGKALREGPTPGLGVSRRRPLRKGPASETVTARPIGETSLGKPVFANALPWNPAYLNFTRADHQDASGLHDAKQDAYLSYADKMRAMAERGQGKYPENHLQGFLAQASEAQRMASMHQKAAERHYQASQKRS